MTPFQAVLASLIGTGLLFGLVTLVGALGYGQHESDLAMVIGAILIGGLAYLAQTLLERWRARNAPSPLSSADASRERRRMRPAPPPHGFADEAGWSELRADLARTIAVIAADHRVEAGILMSKEKWGRLRVQVWVEGGTEAARAWARAEIDRCVETAGDLSEDTCIRCGLPATMGEVGGRMLPLCLDHMPDSPPAPATPPAFPVLLQPWEQSEREVGWGVTVRPDGFSVHRSQGARDAFIASYWQALPDTADDTAPDLYSRPVGDAVAMTIPSDSMLAVALKDRGSLRLRWQDDDSHDAYTEAERLWSAAAPGRGWHADRGPPPAGAETTPAPEPPAAPEGTPEDKIGAPTGPPAELHLFIEYWERTEPNPGGRPRIRADGYSVHRSPVAMETYCIPLRKADPEGPPASRNGLRADFASVSVPADHPLALALAGQDSLRLRSGDTETRAELLAARQLWVAAARERGWSVGIDGSHVPIAADGAAWWEQLPDGEDEEARLYEIEEAQAYLRDKLFTEPEAPPPRQAGATDFLTLANMARASGSSHDMTALWSAVWTLEHWHFVSDEPPHAGDYRPYGEAAADGTRFVMAFTDGMLAARYAPHLLGDGTRKVVPVFALDIETAVQTLHRLRSEGVFGLLFNHPFSGFFAPLLNLIPMYEHHLHRLPPWFNGIDGFDDVVRATGGAVTDPVLAMVRSMTAWYFLADPARPGVPLVRGSLLAFSSTTQAAHAARALDLEHAGLLARPPDEVREWLPALAQGGIGTVTFNLGSEALVVPIDRLREHATR